jgi:hypothetical protein
VRQDLSTGFSVFAFVKGRSELEFVIPFTVADLGLPTASGGRHVADTEAPELAYPLSVATPGATERAAPVRPDESIAGTAWRP